MPIIWLAEAFDYPADPKTGVTTVRLTTSLYHHINIYCEHSFSTPDGRRIAILRSHNADPRLPPSDLLVADLYDLRISILERGITSILVATASWSGWIYYLNANHELMRVNLATLEKEVVWTQWPFNDDFILHTVSPNMRFLVGQMNQRSFKTALVRIDLIEKDWKIIYEDYEISNPHPVYNPVYGRDLSVLKCGGFAVDDRQNAKELGTQRCVSRFLIDEEGKNLRPLPFGEPSFPNAGGHAGWIGATGMVACVGGSDVRAPGGHPQGSIMFAGPDDKAPRVIKAPEYLFNHIAISRCGKYFVSESYAGGVPGPVPLVVGSFATGKFRELLSNSFAAGGAAACGHPHAYFTADNKHVIFNANRSETGHVWAARVPPGFLESLD